MPPRLAPDRGGSRRGVNTPRGRAGSGGPSRGSRPGPAPRHAAHLETIATHVRRPNFGTAGHRHTIQVNSFEVTVPEIFIFHYDVVVEPDRFPARLNLELFKALQAAERGIFTPKVAYDGKKNVFSPRELPLGDSGARKFSVSLPTTGRGTGGGDRPPRLYYITLTKVNKINTDVLHRFIRGEQSHDETVLTAVMALNVVARMNPISKYPFDRRSFYTPQDKRDLGKGLELWRGIFQSIRPTMNKLVLNIDLKAGVMYKPGPLIRLCLEFLGRPTDANPSGALAPAALPKPRRHELKKFLMGLRIQVRSTGNKIRVIGGLSEENANSITFDLNGVQTSVAQYYAGVGLPLRFPDLLCVQLGRSAMVPLEMCLVPPGQLSKRQLSEAQLKTLQEFATVKPAERLGKIVSGLSSLRNGNGPGETDYVGDFGMTIGTAPLANEMRVIDPPTLRYGDKSKEKSLKPRAGTGSWNMVDKKAFRPATTFQRWAILNYDSRFSVADQKRVIDSFLKACDDFGIPVQHRQPVVVSAKGHASHEAQFQNAGSLCQKELGGLPSLVVVVLPVAGAEIYRAIKHLGDIKFGVATQCLNVVKCNRGNQQYWNNVMLKVNAKLGGINAIAESQTTAEFLRNPSLSTIVIGADVIHPAPGAVAKPSYTSVVGSLDSNAAKYVATLSVQEGRQEMIADMKDMCKEVISLHMLYREQAEKAGNAKVPQRLIYFRDGVSEGQFQQVLESNDKSSCPSELESIKAACRELKIDPKITVVIVGKRHHNQFFGGNNVPKDKSENCPAGSVIDSGIVHPTDFDFILQSHAGILGTSRPAYYHVIHDEIGFKNADSMQALAYSLCHTYARCTRSVSIPAPVYYADIVCSRAKFHFSSEFDPDFSDTATQTSRGAAGSTRTAESSYLDLYKRHFKKLHSNQVRNMYFL